MAVIASYFLITTFITSIIYNEHENEHILDRLFLKNSFLLRIIGLIKKYNGSLSSDYMF